MKKVIIGTRGSRLALIQAEMVKSTLLEKHPELLVELKIIKTTGDVITDIPLEKIGDKGIFIKELENSLVEKEIDLAVHSMKDMPTALPEGLTIAAMLPREQPWDVLIAREPGKNLAGMTVGSRIGSSSLRRRAQLLHRYPHLEIVSVRGNLDTRLKKLEAGQFDSLVLAYAGVVRMGWWNRISEVIPGDICLPAVGQGAIGIETRKDDLDLLSLLSRLNCRETAAAVTAERAFLRRLEGGCQVPIGALAEVKGDSLILSGMVASLDGTLVFRGEESGQLSGAEELGSLLANKLLQDGCGNILEQIRMECSQNES